jgi:hypothetical protein
MVFPGTIREPVISWYLRVTGPSIPGLAVELTGMYVQVTNCRGYPDQNL